MFIPFSSDKEIDNEDDRQGICALLFLELFLLFIQKKTEELLDVFLPTVEDDNFFFSSLSRFPRLFPPQKKETTTVRMEKIMFNRVFKDEEA